MKQRQILFAVVVAVCCLSAAIAEETGVKPGAQAMRLPPDAAEIARLVQARTSNEAILATIRSWPREYELTAEDTLNLQKVGVSPEIIRAMVQHDEALAKQEYKVKERPADPAPLFQSQRPRPTTRPGETALSSQPKTGFHSTTSGAAAASQIAPTVKSSSSPTLAEKASTPARRSGRAPLPMIVEQAPPPPKLELVPEQPSTNHIWIRGHWTREEGAWAWVPGNWLFRPAPDLVWMNGFWAKQGKGWVWVPGKWR